MSAADNPRTGWLRPKMLFGAANAANNDQRFEEIVVPQDDSVRIDGEIYAMQAAFEQIEPFGVAARARIFTYLYARLGPALERKSDD